MSWYLPVIFSAFLIGFFNIIEKKGLKKSDPLIFIFFVNLSIAFLSLGIIFFENPFNFGLNFFLLLAIKAFLSGTFFVIMSISLKKMDVSEFSPLQNLSPLLVAILSYFILGEGVGRAGLLGILLIVGGTYLLELKDGLASPIKAIIKNKQIHLMFFGLSLAALCVIIDRFLLRDNLNSIWSFFFWNNWLILFFLSLFVLVSIRNKKSKFKLSFKNAFGLAFLAALIYVFADFSYFYALTMPLALVALVIPIKRMSTLVSTVIGGSLFKERGILRKSLACLLMIAGVFLMIL